MIDKATPPWLDILSNTTIEEAWQQMDARFANTRVVAQAALADYSAFTPKAKSKNEKLIEVAEHVNHIYSDLCAVGKGGELDKTENLILKVLETSLISSTKMNSPPRTGKSVSSGSSTTFSGTTGSIS